MHRQILNRWTQAVLWEGDAETVKDAIHAAYAARADLRDAALMGAVLTAIKSGDAVDVTDLFPASGAGKQYHVGHRALGQGLVRPYWKEVTVVVLKDATVAKGKVTGESTTTGKGLVFVVKAE
jgi:hypothetical protein